MIVDNPSLNAAAVISRTIPTSGEYQSTEDWLNGDTRSIDLVPSALQKSTVHFNKVREIHRQPWIWPRKPIIFIADPHADAVAFERSLKASGAVSDISSNAVTLNAFGRDSRIVIGGDCLDKGPSNLALLDAIKKLKDSGADVTLLAGNHDVRLLMGLRCLEQQDNLLTSHMFLRMGAKIVPLLQEVYVRYVQPRRPCLNTPTAKACEDYLFPKGQWLQAFPKLAAGKMSDRAIQKELDRLQQKIAEFKQAALAHGMDMQALYETALACKSLFLDTDGQYHWFFDSMTIAHQAGSFLFLHAGLDDEIACLLAREGVDKLNTLYDKQVRNNLFDFYYGPVANTMRTKYRADDDFRLTHYGVAKLKAVGIHAVVHGHQNRHHGQRMVLREDLLHFECDTTMDCHSRLKEGLRPNGFGVTLILPEGKVLGISSDYARPKCFQPSFSQRPTAEQSLSLKLVAHP
ncbi:MAG TPA: metallophosphoesterase family protein [Marinagarivorans sp.]